MGRASLQEEAERGVPTCPDPGKIGKTTTLHNIFHKKKAHGGDATEGAGIRGLGKVRIV